MPFDKMRQYIKDEGFCCPWALFVSRKRWFTSVISGDSAVSPRGVRFWRQRFRAGLLKCEGCDKCLKEKIRREQKNLPLRSDTVRGNASASVAPAGQAVDSSDES
jgi:hypothetical protein